MMPCDSSVLLLPPTSVFLPGESHGGRNLVGYGPQGHKELEMTELLHFLSFFSCHDVHEIHAGRPVCQ